MVRKIYSEVQQKGIHRYHCYCTVISSFGFSFLFSSFACGGGVFYEFIR